MLVKDYWQNELAESKNMLLHLEIELVDFPSTIFTLYKISYDSLYNERIFGWLIEPKGKTNYPLVIEYIGYMNHLISPLQFSHWLTIGCGVLVTDSRGQGGLTLDSAPYQTHEEEALMAKGFLDRDDYYLRRLYWDAFRLLDVAQVLSHVNKEQVFIHGTSQGGGIGLFVNSLTPYNIRYGFYDVPSHSNLVNRVEEGTGSYLGIQKYLVEFPESKKQVNRQLEYFDIKNVVDLIETPVLISVGEADPICPKEDSYQAYQAIKTKKELDIYPLPGHGGGGWIHIEKIISYMLKEVRNG